MSWLRRPLNFWLRLTERPALAKVDDPQALRRSFERKARLLFHAPRGTKITRETIGGMALRHVRARGVAQDAPLLLYFHGGAYIFGSPRTHQAMLGKLSALTGLPACLPTYRLAPEHAFPAAIDDALATYKALAGPGRPPIILGGDSAGGGLALALLGCILRDGLPMPLGVFAFSALTDLRFAGASVQANAAREVVLPVERTSEMAQMYLQGADAMDPRASPLFADFKGAPPVWLVAGDTEILLDDTRRMAAHLRTQGVTVSEQISHDLPHVWPIFHNILPEARATLRDLSRWITALSR